MTEKEHYAGNNSEFYNRITEGGGQTSIDIYARRFFSLFKIEKSVRLNKAKNSTLKYCCKFALAVI